MLFWVVRLRSGLSGRAKRRRGFDKASSCAPVASRAIKNAWEASVNRPHLAISLRCAMYDAVWHLCSDAMATLAFSGEVCLHVHVLLSDALSLRSDSVFALPCVQKRQIAMLVSSSAIC